MISCLPGTDWTPEKYSLPQVEIWALDAQGLHLMTREILTSRGFSITEPGLLPETRFIDCISSLIPAAVGAESHI